MADWNPRANELFVRSLDLTEADRAAFLAAECGADADLRRAVDTLLRAHAAAGGFLADPHPDAAATAAFDGNDATRGADDTGTFDPARTRSDADPTRPSPEAGLLAGRYRLGEPLGEGGMGTVYRAEQLHPVRRTVAVKLIKAGTDTARVIARFEAERQALAVMDHPHIAKVLDGGVTGTGQPFFVMELVDGTPLTAFADAKGLTVPQRLELFALVCAAVQHAHQKGIIHRDLKPGNVLVTEVDGKPVPKVIDFGLAKALQAGAISDVSLEATGFGSVLGTPLYMAPEQADPGTADIDTRADVYALGVMLYELLTGSTPHTRESFRRVALSEILRMVREVDPPTPGQRLESSAAMAGIAAVRGAEPGRLARLVRGDLEWVTMKALAKDRDRRYDSAAALAADVGRFLNHEPVTAGPPSRWYRARKFVRRNRGAVTAAAVVVLALVAGVVGTTLGLLEADAQRQYAEGQEKVAKGETEEKEKALAEQTRLRGEEEKARKELEVAFASREYDDLIRIETQGDFDTIAHYLLRVLKTLPEHADELRFHIKLRIAMELNLFNQWPEDASLDLESSHYLFRTNEVVAKYKDGALVLADPLTGKRRVTLEVPGVRLRYMTHTEHANLLVARSAYGNATQGDGTPVRFDAAIQFFFFDIATGRLLGQTSAAEKTGIALDLCPDGTRLITRSGGERQPGFRFHLWDTSTGRRIAEIPAAMTANLSPDNRFVVTYGDTTNARVEVPDPVRVYSARDGQLVHTIPPPQQGRYRFADVTPDGQHLVTFTNDEVRWWRTSDWAAVGEPSRTESNGGTESYLMGEYQGANTSRQYNGIRYYVRDRYAAICGTSHPDGIMPDGGVELFARGEKECVGRYSDSLVCLTDRGVLLTSGRFVGFDPVRVVLPTRYRRYADEARTLAAGGRFLPHTVQNVSSVSSEQRVGSINFGSEKSTPWVVFPVRIGDRNYFVTNQNYHLKPSLIPDTVGDIPTDLLELWIEVLTCGGLNTRNQFDLFDEATWEAKRVELGRRLAGRADTKAFAAAATDRHNWLSRKLARTADPDEALPYLNRFIREEQHYAHFLTRARLHLLRRDIDAVAVDLHEALRLYRKSRTPPTLDPPFVVRDNQYWHPVIELLATKDRPKADYEMAREWLTDGPLVVAYISTAILKDETALGIDLARYRFGDYQAVLDRLIPKTMSNLRVGLIPLALADVPLGGLTAFQLQKHFQSLPELRQGLGPRQAVLLAMCEFRLGHVDSAKRRLSQVRPAQSGIPGAGPAVPPQLFDEARALIGLPTAPPPKKK